MHYIAIDIHDGTHGPHMEVRLVSLPVKTNDSQEGEEPPPELVDGRSANEVNNG